MEDVLHRGHQPICRRRLLEGTSRVEPAAERVSVSPQGRYGLQERYRAGTCEGLETRNLAAKFFQLRKEFSTEEDSMEQQLFEEPVASLGQAVGIGRASNRKRRTRRLAERIREERQALQMIGPRVFIKKRLRSKHASVRVPPKRVVIRRKLLKK